MNTLRVRIAILLIAVIVVVVGSTTAISMLVFGPPGPKTTVEPVAEDIMAMAKLAAASPDALSETVRFSKQPAPGEYDSGMTKWLQETLRKKGSDLDVRVTRQAREEPLVVSVSAGDRGYLLMPMPHLPRPGVGWRIFSRWMLYLTAAAVAIAIFVSYRMTRPLVMLENAVAAVEPEAILPPLPEKGPAEVKATAQALNRLSARLRMAVESRMRLVAAAGHDLRTPMTRMRLRAEFLDLDDEERALWLKDLDELDRIADSAILLVREEVDQPAPEEIRLDELLAEIVDELQLQGRSVTLEDPPKVTVRGSTLALSRALRNLIINAATHGGGASVALRRDNGQALVRIDDEGPGIPDDLLAQIFEPFFRVDPARRQNIAGAGLGLTIAREIVQRAGGDVTIENKDPKGLRQTIRLPLAD
ncbi:Osmolarity sensor protein EnvZ [Methyloligella halotolerans]|uniref:histidine kinase n=1 Tax=Methyloligella halotolerans TaxID=1177755 RepID=A0A1E2RYG4_9HYPH|nr:ATP-binding protein [Methyloligella halotolerans]ODA67148.1 Osmolarity sensor protein EnvZ [Methyloligella halotolerans]